jgi:hypothetical protein
LVTGVTGKTKVREQMSENKNSKESILVQHTPVPHRNKGAHS